MIPEVLLVCYQWIHQADDRLSVGELFFTEGQLTEEKKNLVLKLFCIWSVLIVETLVRKRRKHEGNSHPLIFRASPSQDNGSDSPLWCCSAAVPQQRSCAQTSPRGDLLPQGPAAALPRTLYITKILQRDSKFLPKVEVELNVPLWVQFSNPSNAWEENKHSHVFLFFFFLKIPSFLSFEDSSDHHSRLHLSLRAAKSFAQFQTLQ